MKKISAILSPMVILMASTSLAQDSCIRRPSCEQMGYTKTEAECIGKDSIKCPFDRNALFCPGGGSSSSEPETLTCNFGYLAKNGECIEIDNAIAFVINVTANNGSIELYTGSSNGFIIDWGDGTIDNSLSTYRPSHVYADAGEYQIVITGNVTTFYVNKYNNSHTTKILNLDLDSVQTYGYTETSFNIPSYYSPFKDCSNVTGEIPDELPPNLRKAYALFYRCSGLTGEIPDLPNTITEAPEMFYECSGLTGSIPNLPSSLTNGDSMFRDCSGLTGSIPNSLTNLENGSRMFEGCSGLTGNIPTLLSSLTKADLMFYDCSGLTGSIPLLSDNITDGSYMFKGCSNLTSITNIPSNLTNGEYMFSGCSNLQINIGNLPTGLTNAESMFNGCSQITIASNILPPTLSNVVEMFKNSGLTRLPSNLSSLSNITDGDSMFYGCSKMTGSINGFPPNLEDGRYMFTNCTKLSGNLPPLPRLLTNATYMFFCNYGITSLPTNLGNLSFLKYADSMFERCSAINDTLTSLPPNIQSLGKMFKGCTKLSGTAPGYSQFTNVPSCKGAFNSTSITDNTSDPWPSSAFANY